jgi:hypothetical protein
MPQKIGDLPIGARVRDANTRHFGQPITFRIAAKNHAGYPANSVTLITDRIIALKCFDANEPNNSSSDRRAHGNNRYLHSNLRQWLNSNAATGTWYTAQHSADEPPIAERVLSSHNPYQATAGFLSGFSADMRDALMQTTLTVARNTVTDGGGSETIQDRVFLASRTEVGLENENSIEEGSRLEVFDGSVSRIAVPTAQCASNSTYQDTGLNATQSWSWWLRTPFVENTGRPRSVNHFGTLSNSLAIDGAWGVRPLCNLSYETFVSDNADGEGVFTILWHQPPTAPDGITTPETPLGGQPASISWGIATSPAGSVQGYILERAVNGGAWTQVYRGVLRTFTDTIRAEWSTVQWRVRAFDNHNTEGANTISPLRNVVISNPPVISGSNTNIGLQAGAFSHTYTVTNPDAGVAKTLTVVERINGQEKRTFTATSGTQNTFEVTAADWLEILNGASTLTITATDNFNEQTIRTISFSKNESEIDFSLATPLPADDMLTRAIMNVTRQIPAGANFTVEVCNNGFDASPTWQDVTSSIVSGNRFFIINTNKTAANWGFNFRIRAQRNGTTGDCFIQGIGGNFE